MKWSATAKERLKRCKPCKQTGANPKDGTETWRCVSRLPSPQASESVGLKRALLQLMWNSAG
eukprot:3813380-Amphidinium_carterae.1